MFVYGFVKTEEGRLFRVTHTLKNENPCAAAKKFNASLETIREALEKIAYVPEKGTYIVTLPYTHIPDVQECREEEIHWEIKPGFGSRLVPQFNPKDSFNFKTTNKVVLTLKYMKGGNDLRLTQFFYGEEQTPPFSSDYWKTHAFWR